MQPHGKASCTQRFKQKENRNLGKVVFNSTGDWHQQSNFSLQEGTDERMKPGEDGNTEMKLKQGQKAGNALRYINQ